MIAEMQAPALASGFLRSAERFPTRPALDVAGQTITYTDLLRRAASTASMLHAEGANDGATPLTAVFATRSPTAFAGILGALIRGHGYVPLNPHYPPARNRLILERSGCSTIVADAATAAAAAELTAGLSHPVCVLVPDDRRPTWDIAPAEVDPGDPAYLLFTSGSTGEPKGVAVSHANVRAFLDAVTHRYEISEIDRLSQTFDLTFDLSAFDMFVAWERGACVCCPEPKELLKASEFIRRAAPTVWFSVPSIAMFLQRFGALKPGAFPELRLSLFCGEALPTQLAADWAAAAPQSSVDNLYGPTEATIACTVQPWDDGAAEDAVNGLVPIGMPFGETSVRVVDDALAEVRPGTPGELLLAGPQVVAGYWGDESATARAFVSHPELGHAYLTGDRVVRLTPEGPLAYLGRLDSQIKVLGHRVELGEVEAALRDEGAIDAVAVGWPRTVSSAAGIVAFVEGRSIDPRALRARVASRLPDYMVPREVRLLAELPRTANGKRDRLALVDLLEGD